MSFRTCVTKIKTRYVWYHETLLKIALFNQIFSTLGFELESIKEVHFYCPFLLRNLQYLVLSGSPAKQDVVYELEYLVKDFFQCYYVQ